MDMSATVIINTLVNSLLILSKQQPENPRLQSHFVQDSCILNKSLLYLSDPNNHQPIPDCILIFCRTVVYSLSPLFGDRSIQICDK